MSAGAESWKFAPTSSQLSYRVPSLPRRVLFGCILLVPLLVLLVGVPLYIIATLAAHGVSIQAPTVILTVGGAVLSILAALRYMVRPTRAYGPISVVASSAAIVYLLELIPRASIQASLGKGVTFTVGYGELLVLLLIVPILGIVAGSITTAEDARNLPERLTAEFPS